VGIDQILLGAVVPLYALLWIGGPIVLTNWLRTRRQETIKRQVALTEAIDGRFGAIVAPVVTKPLWGPWEIRIAMPFRQPVTVGGILAVVDEMLSTSDRMDSAHYQIVLTPMQDLVPGERESRTHRPAEKWSGDRGVATA
jgi:hypothetical protein